MRKWPAQVSTVVANVGRELSLLKMAINMANADYLSFFLWNELEPRCQQRAVGSLELLFYKHYADVIMTTMASQITSLTIVYSIVYSDADQRKHQSFASLAFVWGIHRDRWIPRTKGQLRGKCFHLMTSSWNQFERYPKLQRLPGANDLMMTQFIATYSHPRTKKPIRYRSDSSFAPSQWETALLCNDVSHWLGESKASLTGWVQA